MRLNAVRRVGAGRARPHPAPPDAEPELLRIGDDDAVALAPGVRATPGALADAASGAVYPLNSTGSLIARHLQSAPRLGDLVGSVARAYGVPPARVREDVVGFLGRLDTRSLISVRPADRRRVRVRRSIASLARTRGLVLFGNDWLGRTSVSRRRPATVRSLPATCLRAHGVLVAAVLVVSAASAAGTLALNTPTTDAQWRAWSALLLAPAYLVVLHVGLMAVHEAGHLIAIHAVGLRADYTVIRGLSVGIVHRRGTAAEERLVSVAGPVAALVAGCLISLAAGASAWPGRHLPQVMTLFPAAVGVAHLLSLTPWGADGRLLLRPSGARGGPAGAEAGDGGRPAGARRAGAPTDGVPADVAATVPLPALAARELAVTLGQFRLGPLDLDVRAGEIVCLVGPNGAGKTTLLRAVTGLRPPDSGSAHIVGMPTRGRAPEALRRLGWVPDDLDDILPEVTAAELWDLHALAHSSVAGTVEEMRERAAGLARSLDFRPPAIRIAAYSHGMRKKTQLVGGLLHDPDVIILDEPRNGLDPIAIERLEAVMHELRDKGRAVVVATHDLRYAERVADRVCILHDGRVAAFGTVPDVLRDGEDLVQAFFRIVASA